jgi:AbiU2
MTAQEQIFLRELEIFRGECEGASQHVYAYLAIHDVAKRRKTVFRALDRHALFWNTVAGALQGSAIIALGRVFDQSTPHNVDVLLRLAQRSPGMFTRVSLATRKSNGAAAPPPWLPAFIDQVQEPTIQDFRKLRAHVNRFRQVYEHRFRPLRHSVFAHTLIHGPSEVAPVAAKANINELKRLISSLLSLHEALWQLFYNGRAPVLRPIRYPAKRRKDLGSNNRPHERIVAEAEEVLVAAARPNKALHRAAGRAIVSGRR